MAVHASLDFVTRAARGLRGRFGSDVWQAWSNLGLHDQQDWLAKREPAADPVGMRRMMIGILHGEGIKRTEEAACCATCASPITCSVG